MNIQQLSDSLSCSIGTAKKWVDVLNIAMAKYDINTDFRIAHFIAQIGHESGRFIYVKEIASGIAYEGRKDLGNVNKGDGIKYKGRGLIQITGRTNYDLCGKALDLDLITTPYLLELPDNASLSAGWFWKGHGLNELADKNNILAITKKINGGTNGLSDRELLLASCKKVLGI